jgi:hypothetical protein
MGVQMYGRKGCNPIFVYFWITKSSMLCVCFFWSDCKNIALYVGTRTAAQVRRYLQVCKF